MKGTRAKKKANLKRSNSGLTSPSERPGDDEQSSESVEGCAPKKRSSSRAKTNPVASTSKTTSKDETTSSSGSILRPTRARELVEEVFATIPKDKLKTNYNAGLRRFPNLGSNQSATTTLTLRKVYKVTTTENQHSEMYALEKAEAKDEIALNGHTIVLTGSTDPIPENAMKTRPSRITQKDWDDYRKTYETEEKDVLEALKSSTIPDDPMDHCGYCSFFLTLLGVPTEQPSRKPSSYASGQKGACYMVPQFIKENSDVISKLLGKDEKTWVPEVLEKATNHAKSKGKTATIEKLEKLKGSEKFAELDQDENVRAEVKQVIDDFWKSFLEDLTVELKAYPRPPPVDEEKKTTETTVGEGEKSTAEAEKVGDVKKSKMEVEPEPKDDQEQEDF